LTKFGRYISRDLGTGPMTTPYALTTSRTEVMGSDLSQHSSSIQFAVVSDGHASQKRLQHVFWFLNYIPIYIW
jgi:hypothetical protein